EEKNSPRKKEKGAKKSEKEEVKRTRTEAIKKLPCGSTCRAICGILQKEKQCIGCRTSQQCIFGFYVKYLVEAEEVKNADQQITSMFAKCVTAWNEQNITYDQLHTDPHYQMRDKGHPLQAKVVDSNFNDVAKELKL